MRGKFDFNRFGKIPRAAWPRLVSNAAFVAVGQNFDRLVQNPLDVVDARVEVVFRCFTAPVKRGNRESEKQTISSCPAFVQAIAIARKLEERHLTVYSPGHRRLSLGGPSSMVKRVSMHSYSSVVMSVPLGTSTFRRVRDML